MIDAQVAELRERAGEVLARLPPRELQSSAVVDGAPGGLHRGLRRGGGVEFAEHREYSPGDDLRHLDWRVWARNDRFYVKRHEQEVHAAVTLLVDASASMAAAPADAPDQVAKWAAVRLLTATLAALVIRQGDAVGMLVAGRPRLSIPAAGGEGHLMRLLAALLRVPTEGPTGLEGLGRAALRDLERRGVVLAISDLLADPAAALAPLGAMARMGPQVVLLHTLHPRELDLGFAEPVDLICGESGRRQIVDPRVVRRAYVEMMNSHCAAVRTTATSLGVHHLLTNLGDDPAAIIGRLVLVLAARGRSQARTGSVA